MNSRDAAAFLIVAVRVMLYEEGFLRFRFELHVEVARAGAGG